MLPAPGLSPLGNPDLRRYVLPTEQIVLATRMHWAVLLRPIALAIAVFLVVATLVTVGPAEAQEALAWLWLAFLAALGHLAFRWLEWRHEWFISTDKRLLLLYGLIIHKVAMMPLTKVTDMGYTRTPAGYLLGYGRFVLESAGQDQALRQIDFVPHPDETYRTLCGELFKPTPKPQAGAETPASTTTPAPFRPLPGPTPSHLSPVVVPGRVAHPARDARRPATEPIPLPYQE